MSLLILIENLKHWKYLNLKTLGAVILTKKQTPNSEATNKGTTYTNWALWTTKYEISREVYVVFLFSYLQ